MQRKVLITAQAMGYFDIRHRVSIEDIGKALAISKSTAHHHLKEANRKLVEKYIDETKTQ
ncbi:helix-turn-helix domain-containing protein [Methanolobus sp. ZRKC2]|uniref:helix-turn-helix domain-containing protein n=1 Tax=Methanolobus sp. ZRKC2 TaxID=3125783 RepID=UPI00324E2C8B